MADYYCDHGAYGLATNRLGLDVPAWGVPQEGDGTTKDAATAAGVVSIDLTSITSNAGTVSVFGSSAISVGAAASGATLAAQIVAAINGSSLVTAHAALPGAPQVRNLVYARNTGAVLEVMCRIGSAALNVLGIVWGGTWTSATPSNLTFSGGSGGCWGWFINPVAIGSASSIAALMYGSFLYTPYAGALPTYTDFTYVRTGGGASKTIAYATSSNYTLTPGAFDRNLVFDTNTKWTSDITTGKVLLQFSTGTYNCNSRIYLTAQWNSVSYIALARGGFEIEYWDTGGSYATLNVVSVYSSGGFCAEYLRGVTFRDSTPANVSNSFITFVNGGYGSGLTRVWENCEYIRTYARASLPSPLFAHGLYNTALDQRYIGCTFNYNISGVSDPGGLVDTSNQAESNTVFKDCQFLGFSGGYTLISGLGNWPTNSTSMSLVVDNCTGLKMPVTYVGMPSSSTFARQELHQIAFSNSLASDYPGFRLEDCRGVCEWVPNDPTAFPTATAIFPGNNAPWSMRVIWLLSVPLRHGRTYQAPVIRDFTQLAAGVRTLSLLCFLPASITGRIRVVFGYTGDSGLAQSMIQEVISSDATAWGNAASYSGFSAKKFTVTTPAAVKANSEVTAMIELFGPPLSGADTSFYFNPELVIS